MHINHVLFLASAKQISISSLVVLPLLHVFCWRMSPVIVMEMFYLLEIPWVCLQSLRAVVDTAHLRSSL